ncbi:arginyl-tRNA--protein transferase 1 isoform X2 [Ceratina calcarata]|nr:arginyl-tRNA--protein transferase 1 isoform X2 [Ceratina calcarata]
MGKFLRNELHKNDLTMDTFEEDRGGDDIDDVGKALTIAGKNRGRSKREESISVIDVKLIAKDDEVNARLRPGRSMTIDEGRGEQSCSYSETNLSATGSEPIPVVAVASSRNDVDSNGTPQSLRSVEMNSTAVAARSCAKAKLLRKQRKRNKLLAQGKSEEEIQAIFDEYKLRENRAKTFEELFDQVYPDGTTGRLKMRLVRTMSDEFIKTLKVSADLFKKYQMTVHCVSEKESDQVSFFNFLVKSSLQPWTPDDGPSSGYGSFHEQYWLDDELIAVGVIDILPSCVSSVYFFYDPAYSHLSLGTFSSLREVYLTRQLNKVAKDLKYYYMGFYIHACPKMRYKARMRPSYLLCPETYAWFDIDRSLSKLDKQKYSRLNDDIDAIDEDGVVDVDKVLVLYRQVAMPYEIYKKKTAAAAAHRATVVREEEEEEEEDEEEDEIKQYAGLVGMKCAQRLLLYRG